MNREEMAAESARLRDEAMRRVSEANAEYRAEAIPLVRYLAERMRAFTTDELWVLLDEYVASKPTDNRVLGPIMKAAESAGWIARTPDFVPTIRPSQHREPKRVWESLIYQGQDLQFEWLLDA